nr:nucleoside hydrolase [Streptomyces antimycoticus]
MSVVIDTDPGVDDAWAILFLAAQPNVEIVAVGTAHGNVPTAMAAANALRVLDVAGLDRIPVAIGQATPLQQRLETAQFVHGDGTDCARFATSVLDTYVSIYTQVRDSVGCVLHDPLATAIMLDESLATYNELQVVIELAGHSRGATLVDERGFSTGRGGIPDQRLPVRIATTADASVAMERVLRALITLGDRGSAGPAPLV